MTQMMNVPWLYDRHSHVSLYGALQGCPSLAGCDPEAGMALLRGLPRDRITTVLGWQSWRLPLGPADLDALPPALIINFSLHGCSLTTAAKRMLGPEHLDLLERQRDPEWCERNMERLLAFYSISAGLTAAKLDAFMTGLQRVGIGAAEDMLLSDEAALRVIQASPWSGRIRCWTTPGIFRALSPAAQESVAGLKLFTDGALGARTAAMDDGFRGGAPGLLIYDGNGLEEVLAELGVKGARMTIGNDPATAAVIAYGLP